MGKRIAKLIDLFACKFGTNIGKYACSGAQAVRFLLSPVYKQMMFGGVWDCQSITAASAVHHGEGGELYSRPGQSLLLWWISMAALASLLPRRLVLPVADLSTLIWAGCCTGPCFLMRCLGVKRPDLISRRRNCGLYGQKAVHSTPHSQTEGFWTPVSQRAQGRQQLCSVLRPSILSLLC